MSAMMVKKTSTEERKELKCRILESKPQSEPGKNNEVYEEKFTRRYKRSRKERKKRRKINRRWRNLRGKVRNEGKRHKKNPR